MGTKCSIPLSPQDLATVLVMHGSHCDDQRTCAPLGKGSFPHISFSSLSLSLSLVSVRLTFLVFWLGLARPSPCTVYGPVVCSLAVSSLDYARSASASEYFRPWKYGDLFTFLQPHPCWFILQRDAAGGHEPGYGAIELLYTASSTSGTPLVTVSPRRDGGTHGTGRFGGRCESLQERSLMSSFSLQVVCLLSDAISRGDSSREGSKLQSGFMLEVRRAPSGVDTTLVQYAVLVLQVVWHVSSIVSDRMRILLVSSC